MVSFYVDSKQVLKYYIVSQYVMFPKKQVEIQVLLEFVFKLKFVKLMNNDTYKKNFKTNPKRTTTS